MQLGCKVKKDQSISIFESVMTRTSNLRRFLWNVKTIYLKIIIKTTTLKALINQYISNMLNLFSFDSS